MTDINTTDESQDSGHALNGTTEALLRSEIGFWKELIVCSNQPASSTSIERMKQALALAESRLADLLSHPHYRTRNSRAPSSLALNRRNHSQH